MLAIGAYYALETTTTGPNNTAIGAAALCSNTEGNTNVAVGRLAAKNITTGDNNVAIGNEAMSDLTTGNNNISLGVASGADAMVNFTSGQSNRLAVGNNSTGTAYVKVAWTVTSDARDKMNFESVPHGLDFVNKLEPYKFNFKKSREDDTPHGNARYGFKAQDILTLEGDNPIIIDNENEDALKYNGEALVPVLVNAIKELKARIETLENN